MYIVYVILFQKKSGMSEIEGDIVLTVAYGELEPIRADDDVKSILEDGGNTLGTVHDHLTLKSVSVGKKAPAGSFRQLHRRLISFFQAITFQFWRHGSISSSILPLCFF